MERLKAAIEKARAQREETTGFGRQPAVTPSRPASGVWETLPVFEPSQRHMERHRIVTDIDADNAARSAFDLLRTRLLKNRPKKKAWRIGMTSATRGCGKSTVAANIAFSLARAREVRTVLMDFDLRSPRLATLLGYRGDVRLGRFLRGETAVEDHLLRLGDTLAVGFNTMREPYSAELLQSASTVSALEALETALHPDITLVDLPPLLSADDAIGLLSNLDGVLVVIASGATTKAEVLTCEQLIGDASKLLGVLLNKEPALTHPTYDDYSA